MVTMAANIKLKQFLYFLTFVIYSVSGRNSAPKHRNCFQNFNHRIQKCLDPFSKLFKTYQQTQDESSFSSIVKKHICFEYEKMLLCMHSTLTHCPTLRNIKRVQEKLGADWVNNVNGLCRIPPTPKTESQEVERQHSLAENSIETNINENIPKSDHIMDNKIPQVWDEIEAKDKLLQKKEAEMWHKLKTTWRQRVGIMKKRLRLTNTKSEEKTASYTVYNIFYNTNSAPQILTRLAYSNSQVTDISVVILILCFSVSSLL